MTGARIIQVWQARESYKYDKHVPHTVLWQAHAVSNRKKDAHFTRAKALYNARNAAKKQFISSICGLLQTRKCFAAVELRVGNPHSNTDFLLRIIASDKSSSATLRILDLVPTVQNTKRAHLLLHFLVHSHWRLPSLRFRVTLSCELWKNTIM